MFDDKVLKELKKEYDKIEIPNNIDDYIEKAIERGSVEMQMSKRKNKWVKWVGSAAAVFTIFTISINTIPAVANTMIDIPGIGKLVQVLKFEKGSGIGGNITDGTDVNFIALNKDKDIENIVINFSKEDKIEDLASHFKVDYSEYPYTLTFTISGARKFSAEKDLKELKNSNIIKDAYSLITLDDSMIRFSITLNEAVDYEVKEYKEPGQVVVTLRPGEQKDNKRIYSIRSKSYEFGETLGIMEEELYELEGLRILKDQNGTFIVEAGYFDTLKKAENKKEELEKEYESISEFVIEEREIKDIPKQIVK
ncbi:DUF4179 domain-containing protein [Tissierella sp. MSJ-40]|uniref:DUF4179 domain-containing protein n=1 Tax=Tissierella simiarum TaxID=2841534 RepID=A0ABS6EBS9_9FIRM|nr:DUF4179 domain-containing protein [Tissierella simiarum]MBU5440384.1 DUF4179 domain-containing protein [Tissierella simiarum]